MSKVTFSGRIRHFRTFYYANSEYSFKQTNTWYSLIWCHQMYGAIFEAFYHRLGLGLWTNKCLHVIFFKSHLFATYYTQCPVFVRFNPTVNSIYPSRFLFSRLKYCKVIALSLMVILVYQYESTYTGRTKPLYGNKEVLYRPPMKKNVCCFLRYDILNGGIVVWLCPNWKVE